jgi:WD40 repeat protein
VPFWGNKNPLKAIKQIAINNERLLWQFYKGDRHHLRSFSQNAGGNMKKLISVLIFSLLTFTLFGQSGFSQIGGVTQEMQDDGLCIAHPTLRIGTKVWVLNISAAAEIEATVTKRIPVSSTRIADVSPSVWQALGLISNYAVRIYTGDSIFLSNDTNQLEQDAAKYNLLFYFEAVSVAFSPDGRQIISASDETIKLWDAATGHLIRTFSGHAGVVDSIAFSPDGKQIISGSWDTTVKLWDAGTGRLIRTFSGHSGWVRSVAFSPDGRQIISGSQDETIKLWDAATGRLIRTFSVYPGLDCLSVAFSPDGKQIISGSSDGIINLWDAATGRLIRTFSGYSGQTNWVHSVAFSPDGKQIISGWLDSTIKLWDVATGRLIRTFSGHSGWVSSVAFSPDGRHILSGSGDKTIKLWDTATGVNFMTYVSYYDTVYSAAISPDGKQIIGGGKYGQ